jgi:hypothetical protein
MIMEKEVEKEVKKRGPNSFQLFEKEYKQTNKEAKRKEVLEKWKLLTPQEKLVYKKEKEKEEKEKEGKGKELKKLHKNGEVHPQDPEKIYSEKAKRFVNRTGKAGMEVIQLVSKILDVKEEE